MESTFWQRQNCRDRKKIWRWGSAGCCMGLAGRHSHSMEMAAFAQLLPTKANLVSPSAISRFILLLTIGPLCTHNQTKITQTKSYEKNQTLSPTARTLDSISVTVPPNVISLNSCRSGGRIFRGLEALCTQPQRNSLCKQLKPYFCKH